MSTLSLTYWILVAIAVISCYFCAKTRTKQLLILGFSLIFYASWGVKPLILMAVYTTLAYFSAIGIERFKSVASRKFTMISFVILSLGLLGYFKYSGFFLSTINDIAGTSWNLVHLILPVGISFYSLSAISYIADVYTGKISAEHDFICVAIFLLYFPKLTAGPIERADHFIPMIKDIPRITRSNVNEGIQIIMLGLWKKYVIADRLAVGVNAVYAAPSAYDTPSILLAIFSYTIQLYGDFSGYTDMAIGVSKLLGIDLMQNFNLPYCATTPSDLWRRWHISLSSWFKDYVYIPLGGSRCSKPRKYFNLLITMVLSGLWHGAAWTYVMWGAVNGLLQCIPSKRPMLPSESLTEPNRTRKLIQTLLRMFLVYLMMVITCTVFRSDSLAAALNLWKSVLSFTPGISYIYVYAPIYMALVLGVQLYLYFTNNGKHRYILWDLKTCRGIAIFTAEILLFGALAYFSNSAFIYNQF